jgi:hypothetical protein
MRAAISLRRCLCIIGGYAFGSLGYRLVAGNQINPDGWAMTFGTVWDCAFLATWMWLSANQETRP